MTEECFSADQELYTVCELRDAVETASWDVEVGDIVTVWKGKTRYFKASEFIHLPLDEISDRAYDEVGEHVDGWPAATPDQDAELKKMIAEIVDAWADRHGLQPVFYGVSDIEEIRVKITDEKGSFEILAP